MQNIHIDLIGCVDAEDILLRFGEILQFGGPKGNHSVKNNTGWGVNWDAMLDCLRSLEEGGIWGTSPKIQFPLTLQIHNCQHINPHDLRTMEEVLDSAVEHHDGKLKVAYTQ